jgi:hypothetical protein
MQHLKRRHKKKRRSPRFKKEKPKESANKSMNKTVSQRTGGLVVHQTMNSNMSGGTPGCLRR